MPCEPPSQQGWPDQPDQPDLVWAFRQLQREAPPPDGDGDGSCLSPTPLRRTAGDCSDPASPPADDRRPADSPRRPSPPSDSGAVSSQRDTADRLLAEAALARRFARLWGQVSSRRQRRLSAPEPDGDTEWTLLESDGLGPTPGPESVSAPVLRPLPRLQRPAALRQAVAALQQRGRSVVCRLAAAGRQRTTRTAAARPARPVQVVQCCSLFSPEPGLPLFESVSCDNLAEAGGVRRGEGGGEGGSGADDGTPPPPYPGCEPPPPYSLAVTRPTPAERLFWHGLDVDQIAVDDVLQGYWRRV